MFMRHHTSTIITPYQIRMHAVKVEVDLTITNPATSNNFFNSLADLRVLSPTWRYSLGILHHNQYYAVFTSCSQCPVFLSISFALARSASSWQGMLFIYFRVISQEFVSASLRKLRGFFPWFLTGIPLILFLLEK